MRSRTSGMSSANRDVLGHSQTKANFPFSYDKTDGGEYPQTNHKLYFGTTKMVTYNQTGGLCEYNLCTLVCNQKIRKYLLR